MSTSEEQEGLPVSNLPDADMRGAPAAMLRAAQRVREIAWRTGTAIVIVRDGQIIEQKIIDDPFAPEPLARKCKGPPDVSGNPTPTGNFQSDWTRM